MRLRLKRSLVFVWATENVYLIYSVYLHMPLVIMYGQESVNAHA